MFVYKITNLINKKVYIGQTIRPIQQRFKRYISDALNKILDTHLSRAIRHYGACNFKIEQIETCASQEELNLRERFWIRFYDSTNLGYNETDAACKSGGNTYHSKTEEEKRFISKKLRETKIGKHNPRARSVKVLNINTNEEIVFSTVKECKEFFNENTHRFVTNRVTGKTRSLYKNQWKISYYEDDYMEFSVGKHRKNHINKYLV